MKRWLPLLIYAVALAGLLVFTVRALDRGPFQRSATGNEHAYYLYVASHGQRDQLVFELASREILVNVSYPWPIHTMPAYETFGDGAGSLPITEAAANRIFSLPMYPALTQEQQAVVIDALRELAPAD